MEFSDILTHGTSVTKLYIEAAKINEKDRLRDAAAMMSRIAENPEGFTVIRVKFSNLLTSYYTTYRTIACDILHDFFPCLVDHRFPKRFRTTSWLLCTKC